MRSLACVLLLAPLAADAAGGKAGKAEKRLAAFESGQRDALSRAVTLADAAVATRQPDASAWAVRGRAYLLLATNPDVSRPPGDPAAVAVESYERALAADPDREVRAAMARELPTLESVVVAALADVHGRDASDAAKARLDLALRAHALALALGVAEAGREAEIRRLAVQVTAAAGQPRAAREHYEAFVTAAGHHHGELAALVARGLADAGDLDGALAFLAPLDREIPDDEHLLRTEVDLLLNGERPDDATARVQQAEARLATSVSGAVLAATLYDRIGAVERARVMWERVVALDPEHLEGRIALGRSYTALARELRDERASLGEEAMLKGSSEVVRLDEALADAWAAAEEHLLAARWLDDRSAPALAALIDLYTSRVEGIDESTLRRAQRDAVAAQKRKLDDARAALAALEEP